MGRFLKSVAMKYGLALIVVVLSANVAASAAEPAPQVNPAAEKVTANLQDAKAKQKAYKFADLPALKIFGNDSTTKRLRALAEIKTTAADQIKGFIEGLGGNHLELRVPRGEYSQQIQLKVTEQTQFTLDGNNVNMKALLPMQRQKPLQAALITTSSDRNTALKVEVQNLLQTGNGKSRQILAMSAPGPKADKLYVVEVSADLGGAECENGEYLLWTLTPSGQVIGKNILKKKDDSYDPPPGTLVIPLPEPRQGAIVMGPFGKLSGTHQWRLFRVDRQGMTSNELKGIWNCHGSSLTANNQSILAVGDNVGRNRIYGMLWRLDLDGKILSKKSYERRTLESFHDIVMADDRRGFIIAEQSPEAINKFGAGKCTVWLLRCNSEGEVLVETSFPGRLPKICALGGGRFAVLYDAGISLPADWRLRVVDLQLKQQWEQDIPFAGFSFDRPGICITATGGLVLAGPAGEFKTAGPMGKLPMQPHPGLEIIHWDREGRKLSSVLIPAVLPAVKHDIHVACAADCVYVAVRTTGFLFRNGVESCVYRIPLSEFH